MSIIVILYLPTTQFVIFERGIFMKEYNISTNIHVGYEVVSRDKLVCRMFIGNEEFDRCIFDINTGEYLRELRASTYKMFRIPVAPEMTLNFMLENTFELPRPAWKLYSENNLERIINSYSDGQDISLVLYAEQELEKTQPSIPLWQIKQFINNYANTYREDNSPYGSISAMYQASYAFEQLYNALEEEFGRRTK